jgi:hypothetical protein
MSELIGKISGQLLEDDLTRLGSDLVFDTDLLYLDVANRKIGAKNTNAGSSQFLISGDATADDLIVDTQLTVNDSVLFYGNTIQTPTGPININVNSATGILYAPGFKTSAGLEVRGNDIQSLDTNQSINFYPGAIARTNIYSNVLVNGGVRATGNVTFDGNLVFGDSNTDGVEIKADISSDIRPNQTDFYSLGELPNKSWLDVFTVNTYTDSVTNTGGAFAGANNLTTRQGKIWYVSVNGLDTNVGNHENGPYLTITKALSVAQSGDTIQVYPGTYIETTPMIVPVGVTLKGLDLRTTLISPTSATRTNDVFLLSGETTIEDLTIVGFEYDSIANTGHAFRFRTNIQVVSRSPYIRNVSVITQGSSARLGTSASDDPRGYHSHDAGRGAYIDGAVVNASSKEASMLFHSCTFICPGVDCITMLNGVRVEWLNSFTYFASIGLYALQGTNGFAAQSVKFGAELRSINSATIYGNIGAKADGANTLMYLVGHNFAYVGSQHDKTNDPTLAVEGNEAVKLNDGVIYFQSTDQSGNVRVGNVFKVNGETGAVSFLSTQLNVNGSASLLLTDGSNRTYLDPLEVTTGNITIQGNTISSLSGDIIFSPSSQIINLAISSSPLTIPKGNDSTLVLHTVGEVRYNIDNNNFEGFAANGLVSLYSISDSTRSTKITPELIPGANDQTIRMYSNNDLKVQIKDTKTTFKNLNISGLNFAPASLNLTTGTDLTLVPTGTGVVNSSSWTFGTSTLTNNTVDGNISLVSTGSGYFKFGGAATLMPSGDDLSRPTSPEVGMHRFNTYHQYLEVWNGTEWVVATGGNEVSSELMTDIADFWALIIG